MLLRDIISGDGGGHSGGIGGTTAGVGIVGLKLSPIKNVTFWNQRVGNCNQS